ncbi:TetR/AcrR family transcriptional regulator [Nocardioides albidus]|uniref:TetR/AcrR family transcriptional regulator n=1 Tax=Nocardioides albidus TaxID=1517589 RepID=A0A5C4VX69_9ACTN|nr:TetR/AcrR family transcriptional regulator [Nocardioides albidus]TNM40401.1 TetR/AcrR family transcriptional regulator [Nocardioides albidus]
MKSDEVRRYDMTSRAAAAAATGERILDAAIDLFWERPTDQIVLADVAERAGVTVQTVLRRFGNKDQLLAAAGERQFARTASEREVPADDPERAVDVLLEHYETHGAGVLRLLAAESSAPLLSELADRGRALHRQWCVAAFPAALRGLRGAARSRRTAQLVAVCDIHTWKLLRLDSGLSRVQTRLALLELLGPLLHPIGEPA